MEKQPARQNPIAAIRVSTGKQGFNGDSPEAQKEQTEGFAAARGIAIKEYFVFLESASKELQQIQQAINYCKDSKNDIQLFIVKSIDRFTRGGSFSYDSLKLIAGEKMVRYFCIKGRLKNATRPQKAHATLILPTVRL